MTSASLDVDLFAPTTLHDSRDCYTAIRDAGRVVWLPRHRMWAMGGFDDVRAALRDDVTFISGRGVGANPVINFFARGTTLASDGAAHDRQRKVLMRAVGAQALAPIAPDIEARAEQLVAGLLARGEFDAVADFASDLPVNVVADLVGVEVDSARLLRWAAGAFDGLGPLNGRMAVSMLSSFSMLSFAQRLTRSKVKPGSWAETLFAAADAGELSRAEAKMMIIDFIAPALDTTILASAHLLWLLATTPGAWAQLRADPSLVNAAVVEAVRVSSPIRVFTRYAARDYEVDGARIRAGDRVAMVFAAANLDPRRFPEPEVFDLTRGAAGGQLGWGNGPHTCVGIHLAKLEMAALLRAVVAQVSEIEVGTPTRLVNHTLQGFTRLPARFA